MAKGSTFEGDWLKLIFNGTAIANIADNTATSPLTSLVVGLHTGDPSGGDQTTNEVSYAAYNRINTTRSTAGWVVTGAAPASVSPVGSITFPQCTSAGSSATVITHASVGTSTSGVGKLLYSGTVTPNLTLGQNVTPQITSGSSITES